MYHPEVPCQIRGSNNVSSPANLGMLAQVTCQAGVTRVEEVLDRPGLAVATRCITLEDMGLAVFNILNRGGVLKKDINRCIPFLRKVVYYIVISVGSQKGKRNMY